MSEKSCHGKKCLKKTIYGVRIYLYKSFSLLHGNVWFAHTYSYDLKTGYAYSKNKFTAVRNAIKNLK